MVQEVQFELFANSSPMGKDLVSLWHQRARSAGSATHPDSFDALTRLWTGFNNWGMRVTEADFDADMIRKLAGSPALNAAFAERLAADNQGVSYAKVFAKFWPIFNVKDIRKKGLRHQFHELERPEYVQKMLGANVKHAPQGNFNRDMPTWSESIQAIYQVRCNLIHGEKGDSSEDYQIVEGAYRVLITFIDEVDLYHWPACRFAQRYLERA
jgi:hypothetical protein